MFVIQLADGTHHREPPPDHPNQQRFTKGQLAAVKYETEAAARQAIKQHKLKGASVVPYWYARR